MSFLSNLKPGQRAIGISVIAAAGCAGLYFAVKSGSLESWGLPFLKPWQVLILVSWGINSAAIAAGGRLDGSAMGAEVPTDNKDQSQLLPSAQYFRPSGWAFAIWGPIILGETALAIYQALPFPSVMTAGEWLSSLSPWLAAAFLFQTCWCLSFREWAKDSGLLWFPATLLGCTAVCLWGAHHVLRTSVFTMSILQYLLVHLPVSLHFGWVSCATLVNLNRYIALVPRFSDTFKFRFSLASIIAAVWLAIAVTGWTSDPVYAAVVSWALLAVASNREWPTMPDAEDFTPPTTAGNPNTQSPLLPSGLLGGDGSRSKTEALYAKIGAGISAIVAILRIWL